MQAPQQPGVKTKQRLRRNWRKRAQVAKPEDESWIKTGTLAGGKVPRGESAQPREKQDQEGRLGSHTGGGRSLTDEPGKCGEIGPDVGQEEQCLAAVSAIDR